MKQQPIPPQVLESLQLAAYTMRRLRRLHSAPSPDSDLLVQAIGRLAPLMAAAVQALMKACQAAGRGDAVEQARSIARVTDLRTQLVQQLDELDRLFGVEPS